MLLTTLFAFLASAHATNQHQWGIIEDNNGQWSEVIQNFIQASFAIYLYLYTK